MDYVTLLIKGSDKFIFESDKDNVYSNLLLVKRTKKTSEFDQLLKDFLNNKNKDLLTKEAVIRYIRENKKRENLNDLILVRNSFESINEDSVWTIEIEKNRFRSNKLKNSVIVPYLNETINELSEQTKATQN